MDYGREQLADRLAAEYVLGTLRGPARRRMAALLPAHPALRRAVDAWQNRLMSLSVGVTPVQPSQQVWRTIEQRLFGSAADRTARRGWWQRLGLWQGGFALATVAALALALLLAQPRPVAPPIVIVLSANPEAQGVTPASFVASVTPDGRALVLKPIAAQAPAGRSYELWSVPGSGAPRSLGVVSDAQATTVLRARLLDDTAAFAVSLEPSGGSPSGAPTGPIVSVGKLSL